MDRCQAPCVNILVVGGDARTAQLLERRGHAASLSTGAEQTFLDAGRYDAILLGSALGPPLALALCRGLRARGVQTAVLLLVEQNAALARIEGLEAGADDCLSTPFMAEELLARLRAIVRRSSVRSG